MGKKKLLDKKGKNQDDIDIDAMIDGETSSEQEGGDAKRKFNIKRVDVASNKKLIIIIAIVLILILIVVVFLLIKKRKSPEFEDVNTIGSVVVDEGKPIENYFKFTDNTLYQFTQKNGSSMNKDQFVAYSDFDTVQYSVYSLSVGDEWYNQVFEVKNGEIRCIVSDMKYKQNVNLLEYNSDEEPIVVLKEPVALNNTWKIGSGDAEATITKVDYDVKTPCGLYKTVEVTTDYKNGNYKKEYYSETMGLVRIININNDGTTTDVELTEAVSLSAGLDRAMYVYYLENGTFNDEPILVQYQQPTNKAVKDVFTEILRESKDTNYKPLISPYTKINSIKLDNDLRVVHVDLSKEFLDYTSKNKSTETKHLNALANTFCRYYQVLNLKLTIDGQPYSSANFKLGENDTIKATFK